MDTESWPGCWRAARSPSSPFRLYPTGISMSQPCRGTCCAWRCSAGPIIEDDWGRQLRYEGDSTAAQVPFRGSYVIHTGLQQVFPGLRIGWITCPASIGVALVRAKIGADSGDSTFLQALLFDFIQKGHFDRHIRKTVKEYKARRDAMCSTLSSHLAPECRFRIPQGGLSVWVELPEGMSSLGLLRLARDAGVDFAPAAFMMPERRDAAALRLSFSRNSTADIVAGVKILCSVIADCIERPELLADQDSDYEGLYQ